MFDTPECTFVTLGVLAVVWLFGIVCGRLSVGKKVEKEASQTAAVSLEDTISLEDTLRIGEAMLRTDPVIMPRTTFRSLFRAAKLYYDIIPVGMKKIH